MPPKTKKNFFGITDVGRMRDNNEDTFIAEPLPQSPYLLACVIDGVGGYEGGEVAAELARSTVLEYLRIPSGEVGTMVREAIQSANEKIIAAKENGTRLPDMACVITLAMVDITGNKFYYGHVGDTRLYLFRDKTLVKISHDQSFVGFLEDSGRLTEEAAMTHPKRNEINKALGFQPNIRTQPDYIEIGESPFLPGDMLLLCSDGLTDLVNSQVITAALSAPQPLEQKAKALVDAANKAGGKDNITVVLVVNNSKPIKQVATKPVLVKKNDRPQQPEAQVEKQVRRKNKWLLPVIAILLLGAAGWFFWPFTRVAKDPGVLPPVVSQKTEAERRLNDSLNGPARMLVLSPEIFGDTILIRDTLTINRDTVHIKGNNVLLLGDTTLTKTPLLIISENCRYVLLDSLRLQNLQVLVEGPGEPLHFRNVQLYKSLLRNRELYFPDSTTYSGRIRTVLKAVKDTLVKINR
jgi:serine/threonine protein phosphatase PrpC